MILYWLKYILVKFIIEGLFLIISIPLFPVAYLLKHKAGVNIPPFKWMMNDTEDGDFGDANWRAERGITKDSFWVAWIWWWRNSNWNFKHLITPKQGKITDVRVITEEVPPALSWVIQNERGTNHVYFKQGGQLNGRYSFTNNYINLMMGSEKRYIFKLRRSK